MSYDIYQSMRVIPIRHGKRLANFRQKEIVQIHHLANFGGKTLVCAVKRPQSLLATTRMYSVFTMALLGVVYEKGATRR